MSNNKDPYIDKKTGALLNKYNIFDKNLLDKLENDIIPGRIISLKKKGMIIDSVFKIQNIHLYLFGTIFEWAGQFRTITIYKSEPILEGASIDYTPFDYIQKEMMELEKEFKEIKWDKLAPTEKIKQTGIIIQKLWQIHCFREGNTRTVTMFLYFLMKTVGLTVNVNFISKHSKYFRNALVLASCYSRSKPDYLYEIIKDASTLQSISNKHRYKTIEGHELDKYTYSYHTINELKTIKTLQELEKKRKYK